MGTEFILTYPSTNDILDQISKLDRSCCLYKVDISRPFRHIQIDPGDYTKLRLRCIGFLFNSCMPFDFQKGSSIFQRVSDDVR